MSRTTLVIVAALILLLAFFTTRPDRSLTTDTRVQVAQLLEQQERELKSKRPGSDQGAKLKQTLAAADSIRLPFDQGDPRQVIIKMREAARQDGKFVLINFGADWCADCRVLEKLLQTPSVRSFVDSNFHVVTIDVGFYLERDKTKNTDLASTYGLDLMVSGIPAIVVVDAANTAIASTADGEWRSAKRFTVDDLLASLRRWAPKKS